MATENQYNFYNTAGQVIAAASNAYVGGLSDMLEFGFIVSVAASPVTIFGYRAINVVFVDSAGDTFNHYLIVLELADTDKMPGAALLSEQGVQESLIVQAASGGSPLWDVDVFATTWASDWITCLIDTIEAWSEAAVVDSVTNGASFFTDTIDRTMVVLFVQTLSDLIQINQGLTQDSTALLGSSTEVYAVQTQGEMTPATQVAGNNVDLSKLTQAVNDVADQDMSITANQGGFGYEVKSKVMVGP